MNDEPGYDMVVDSSFNWISVILPIVYVAAILYFAVQTWELVDHLFPAEQLAMKVGTVLTFDFAAAIWLAVKMFAKFHVWSNYGLAKGMWRITFTLATAASAIQMYLSAVSFTYASVDVKVIWAAYAMVVVAAVVNIVALGHFINTEWDAVHPRKFVPHNHSGNVLVSSNRPRSYFIEEKGRAMTVVTPQPKEEVSLEQTATLPEPRTIKPLPPMRVQKGKAGRKHSDDTYARLWLEWEATEFSEDACPWNNPHEFRNRYPKEDAIDRVLATANR